MNTGEFITLILRKLGTVGAGESASAEDYADAKAVIDTSMQSMHADGLLWWAVKTANVAFTGSTGTRPTDCAVCVYATWNGVTVRLIERLEYERIQDKTETGDPEYLLDDGATLTVWPVPSSGNIRLTYQREILPTAQGAAFDAPDYLIRPLIDYLAADISGFFPPSQENAARINSDGAMAILRIRSLSRQTAEQAPVQTEYF